MSVPRRRRRPSLMARILGGGVASTVLVATGCDLVVILLAIAFLGPLYPGQPQPPPPAPKCPITVPPRTTDFSALPALPEDLRVDDVVVDCAVPNRPALARLNRAELARSLQALTGIETDLEETLPPDTSGGGLDVIAALHTVSPLLVERLEQTAHDVVDGALRLPGDRPTTTTHEAEGAVGVGNDENGFVTMNGGTIAFPVALTLPGTWAFRVRVAPVPLAGEAPRIIVRLDGDDLLETTLNGPRNAPMVVEVRYRLQAEGRAFQPIHRLEVIHINHEEKDGRHRSVRLDAVDVVGPIDPPSRGATTDNRARLVHCDLDDETNATHCAEEVLQSFAFRGWRGQLTADDVIRLNGLLRQEIAAGDDVETALKTGMAAVLLSPRFLYRLELDPALGTALGTGTSTNETRPLVDQELAARLAALLWSSTPDDRLLELAAQGALRDERVLTAETERMLNDPRSTAVVERFMAAWLGLEALDHARPDPDRFPDFDEDLRLSMRCEAELLADRVFREGGGVDELLTSPVANLNHRLAKHYGLPPPDLDDESARGGYVETNVDGIGRRGLLATGAVLTMTSQPARTSPTRRGKWVLERLLCTSPPPPPPGVEALIEDAANEGDASVRALLEQHRADPFCASCHDFIDPMGLALESYDGVGRRRGSDGGVAIDDSALWFGSEDDFVHGPIELAERLADDELVDRCLAERALSYGTGILMAEAAANCAIDDVTARAAARGGRFTDVLLEVVLSPAFRARRLTDVDPTPDDVGGVAGLELP